MKFEQLTYGKHCVIWNVNQYDLQNKWYKHSCTMVNLNICQQ